jgi:membrane-associated phospholipid phosphatase
MGGPRLGERTVHQTDARTSRLRALATAGALAASLVATLTPCAPLAAQTPAAPDTGTHEPLFLKRDAWVAAGFVLGTVALFPLDKHLANEIQGRHPQANRLLRHQATNVRLITESSWFIGGGLYVIGRVSGNRNMADLGLHGTEALAIGAATATLLKGIFGRGRPYLDVDRPTDFGFGRGFGGGDHASFPSGHTTAAFAAASAVTSESLRWWPKGTWIVAPLMYGGATAVGLSRMYNNKHWGSDVVLGAAIGTFSGLKVVRYHHAKNPNNRFDRWLLGARLVDDGAGGRALALILSPDR